MDKLDNSLKTVEELIRTGLAQGFYRVFGTPLLFYSGPDIKQVAAKELKRPDKDLYPFVQAKVTNVALSQTNYRPTSLLRRGMHSGSNWDRKLTYELNMIPVTTTYEINYFAQSLPEVLNFSKLWLMGAARGGLGFTVTYGVTDIDIKIQLEWNVSIPQREGGTTEVKEYQLTTSLTVLGYMNEQLKTSQAVTDIGISLEVLNALTQSGGQVALFTSGWPNPSGPSNTDPSVDYHGDLTLQYTPPIPSTLWTVVHNFNKFPSVTVTDTGGNLVEALVHYPNLNTVLIEFSSPFGGYAFIN